MSNLGRTIRGFVFIAGQLDNNIKEEGVSRWHTLFLCCIPKSRSLPPKICDTHLQVDAELYDTVKRLTSMLRKGWLQQWKRFAWSAWNIRRQKSPRTTGKWHMDFGIYSWIVLGTRLLTNSSLTPVQNYDFHHVPTQRCVHFLLSNLMNCKILKRMKISVFHLSTRPDK